MVAAVGQGLSRGLVARFVFCTGSRPVSSQKPTYSRRQAEKTALYRVVQENYRTLVAITENAGKPCLGSSKTNSKPFWARTQPRARAEQASLSEAQKQGPQTITSPQGVPKTDLRSVGPLIDFPLAHARTPRPTCWRMSCFFVLPGWGLVPSC